MHVDRWKAGEVADDADRQWRWCSTLDGEAADDVHAQFAGRRRSRWRPRAGSTALIGLSRSAASTVPRAASAVALTSAAAGLAAPTPAGAAASKWLRSRTRERIAERRDERADLALACRLAAQAGDRFEDERQRLRDRARRELAEAGCVREQLDIGADRRAQEHAQRVGEDEVHRRSAGLVDGTPTKTSTPARAEAFGARTSSNAPPAISRPVAPTGSSMCSCRSRGRAGRCPTHRRRRAASRRARAPRCRRRRRRWRRRAAA